MASRITDNPDRAERFAEPAAYAPRAAGLYSEVSWPHTPSPATQSPDTDQRERSTQ